jgi:hypothetical protein
VPEPDELKFEWDIVQGGPLSGALAVTKGIVHDEHDGAMLGLVAPQRLQSGRPGRWVFVFR